MMQRRDFLTIAGAGALASIAKPSAAAPAMDRTLLYVCGAPNQLLVLDEADQKVVDKITLPTGVGRGLVLSADRSKIYLNTWPYSGIEVIDRNTHKVINSFKLDNSSRRLWPRSFAVDSQDRFLYTFSSIRTKLADRFETELPKILVIDLAQQKIARMIDYPKEELNAFSGGGGVKLSPDGKYLYQFRDKVLIFETTDFKLVQKIDLAKPSEFPEMENVSVSIGDDPHDLPGMVTSIFNSTDPVIHHPVFGLARFDLAQRKFDFTPMGPAINFMTGLKLTPDRKTGYLVAFREQLGNRHTEFWVSTFRPES